MTTSSTAVLENRPERFAPIVALTNEIRAENIAARFFADHRMTVLNDDGLYRHLRFANPKFHEYHFDLVTWPGHLAISGDIGANVFAREEDMIGFFAGATRINPSYWSEKIVDSSPTKVHTELATRLFLDEIIDALADEIDHDGGSGREPRYDLRECARILEDDVLDCADDEHAVREALHSAELPSSVADMLQEPMSREFDLQLLLRLHAIRIGVAIYVKHRAELDAELSTQTK